LSVSKDAIMQEVTRSYKRRAASAKKERFNEIVRETSVPKDNINPERAKHIKAAKAEDTLLATIIRSPDFYSKIKDKISEDIFVTDFNKRVYSALAERLENGRSIDLSVFASEFTPEEMGRLAQFTAMGSTVSNTLTECDDCINVLKQEKAKMSVGNPAEMSDEDFLNLFKK
jgi:DNA primase